MDEIVELMANAVIKNNGYSREDTTLGEWYALTGHLRAALSSLHESGYSVVPNEPTNVMVEVGTEARWRSAVRDANNIREIYRAMLAASPTSPTPAS